MRATQYHKAEGSESAAMPKWSSKGLILLIYIVVGIVIAWNHSYLNAGWLKTLLSALLAVFLWWLVLLGVNVHIH
jgi:hypothetical protein